MAAPLFAKHVSLLPAELAINRRFGIFREQNNECRIDALEKILQAHDPFFEPSKEFSEYVILAQHVTPNNAWSFERVEQDEKLEDVPLHIEIKRPYISRMIALPVKNGGFCEVADETTLDDLIYMHIRCDVFDEYATITRYIEEPVNPRFFEMMGFNCERGEISISSPEYFEKIPRLKYFLYEEFWDKLEKFISTRKDAQKYLQNYREFADFRFIVPAEAKEYTAQIDTSSTGFKPKLEKPKAYADGLGGNQTSPFHVKDGKALEAMGRYWPYWQGGPHQEGETEIVACTFLDDSILFVSTLGFQTAVAEGKQPQRSCMVCGTTDPWQLGRIMYRILALGTLRLMAIRQIHRIHVAGWELDDVLEKLLKTEQRARWFWPTWHGRMRRRLAQIQSGRYSFEVPLGIHRRTNDGERTKIVGGLDYRLVKSHYYSESFNERVKDLRVEKIPGYQSYEELVRRRLLASFRSIADARTKLERARRQISDMDKRNTNIILVALALVAIVATVLPYAYPPPTGDEPVALSQQCCADTSTPTGTSGSSE